MDPQELLAFVHHADETAEAEVFGFQPNTLMTRLSIPTPKTFYNLITLPGIGILFDGIQLFPMPLYCQIPFFRDFDLCAGFLPHELFLNTHQPSFLQFGQLNGQVPIAQSRQPPQGEEVRAFAADSAARIASRSVSSGPLLIESRAETGTRDCTRFAETCQVFGGYSSTALLRLSFPLGDMPGHAPCCPLFVLPPTAKQSEGAIRKIHWVWRYFTCKLK